MATDPVRGIRRRHIGHAFKLGLDGAIARLADLPPEKETPYLTAKVNWEPEGTQPGRQPGEEPIKASQRRQRAPGDNSEPFRPARIELESAGDEILAGFEERTPARDSVEADLKRIQEYLGSELDMAASGAIIVANHGAGVFQTVTLALPVETTLNIGPMPSLRALVRVAEDNEPYAVLRADQHESTLTFFVQNRPIDELVVRATDYPRRQATGGWSQRRLQQRADERIEAVAREVAEQTRSALKETGVDRLIVAGSEVMTSALDAVWHDEVREVILDTIRVAPDASLHDIAEQVQPILKADERGRELDAVEQAEAAIGMQELGRSGAQAVAAALALGQVEKANARWLLLREIAVSLLNGVGLATVVGLAAGIWFLDWTIGVIIFMALMINLVAAALAGVCVPLGLKRMGIDPALAGSVILTTVTDTIGFASLLGLGTVFLT